jgi:hypothetical protein
MMTLEEYKKATVARRTDYYYCGAALLIIALFAYAVPFGLLELLKPYQPDRIEASAQWFLERNFIPSRGLLLLIVFLVPLPIVLVLAFPTIAGLRFCFRQLEYQRPRCPHCNAPPGGLVVLTGNCLHCGKPVVQLPDETPTAPIGAEHACSGETAPPTHRLLTVEEFNAAVHLRHRLEHRYCRLRCPHCQANLLKKRSQNVVATRACPECRTTLLQDPEGRFLPASYQVEPPRLSVAAFKAFGATYRGWCLLGAIALPGLAVTPAFLVLSYEALLQRTLNSRTLASLVLIVLVFAALALGGWLAIGVGRFADLRLRGKLYLDCPHCGRSLLQFSGIVIATRRCCFCGRRALAEEQELNAA